MHKIGKRVAAVLTSSGVAAALMFGSIGTANAAVDCPEDHICFYEGEDFTGAMESFPWKAGVTNLAKLLAAKSVHNYTDRDVTVFEFRDGKGESLAIQNDHSHRNFGGLPSVRSFSGTE